MKKVIIIFGTRPEAIKLAPVIKKLQSANNIDLTVCVTGQHRQMLDQVLELFDIIPDIDLDIMTGGQSLEGITAAILKKMSEILINEKYDLMLVHGDVTSAVGAALSAFYHKTPVGHIEAGLRTNNIYSPWPEEMNRRLLGQLSKYHFAPTNIAKENLLKENIYEDNIFVTGNTVIDAVLYIKSKIETDTDIQNSLNNKFSYLNKNKKLILVTGHRRENFDGGLENVAKSLQELSKRDDTEIIYPVHLNPNVQNIIYKQLKDIKNIHLIDPVDYLDFVYLMMKSYIIITDSGGIQEEAPSLGKPVLVTRDTTERPEAVSSGTVILTGTNSDNIIKNTIELLDNKKKYQKMSKTHNPYGDGNSSINIINILF